MIFITIYYIEPNLSFEPLVIYGIQIFVQFDKLINQPFMFFHRPFA